MDRTILAARLAGWHLVVRETTTSTNDEALQLAEAGRFPALVIARRQTRGRGRRGRRWFADPEASLAMTVLVRLDVPLGRCLTLPLAAGLGVFRALAAHASGLALKWPNDVLAGHAKLAGILIETRMLADGVAAAIGVGVNLARPRGGFPDLGRPVAVLAEHAPSLPAREALAAAIAEEIAGVLARWQREGFAAMREEWWRAHGGARPVQVRLDGRVLAGEAIGIGEDGALWLRTGRRIVPVTLGEVEALG